MIGDKMGTFRKNKVLTQDGLARRANIPYTTLIKSESNPVKNLPVQRVERIAIASGISVEDLIK